VQRRTRFGNVHGIAAEQALPRAGHVRLGRELEQGSHDRIVDALLGEVDEQPGYPEAVRREAVRVRGVLASAGARPAGCQAAELEPGGQSFRCVHDASPAQTSMGLGLKYWRRPSMSSTWSRSARK
jgi:hypothetical protein